MSGRGSLRTTASCWRATAVPTYGTLCLHLVLSWLSFTQWRTGERRVRNWSRGSLYGWRKCGLPKSLTITPLPFFNDSIYRVLQFVKMKAMLRGRLVVYVYWGWPLVWIPAPLLIVPDSGHLTCISDFSFMKEKNSYVWGFRRFKRLNQVKLGVCSSSRCGMERTREASFHRVCIIINWGFPGKCIPVSAPALGPSLGFVFYKDI